MDRIEIPYGLRKEINALTIDYLRLTIEKTDSIVNRKFHS
jgi:hypothetical protein